MVDDLIISLTAKMKRPVILVGGDGFESAAHFGSGSLPGTYNLAPRLLNRSELELAISRGKSRNDAAQPQEGPESYNGSKPPSSTGPINCRC